MKSRAILICFTGIDGTGKTTLAKSLEESLEDSGISSKYLWGGWRGFESFLFSQVAKFMRENREARWGAGMRSINIQNNFIFTYAAWIDYFLRVFPNLLKSLYKYDLVILDRYVYDVAIGFSINTKNDCEKLLRRFFYIFPKPDTTFLIDVPEEVAYTRKDDIPSVEYLHEKRKIYKKIGDEFEMIGLDGTKSLRELNEKIKKEVIKLQVTKRRRRNE